MPAKKVTTKVKSSATKTVASSKVVKTQTVKSEAKIGGLTVPVYELSGAKKGTVALSKEIFGAEVNEKLLSQAIRVHQVNQRQGTASSKTRGDVTGSTRKIYRQKGTGRARHGGITAPIFVGGGTAFGPHPRPFELKLSKQMKKKALFSALSAKLSENKVFVVDQEAATGKTKEVSSLLKALSVMKKNKSKILFVSDKKDLVTRGVKNIDGVTSEPAHNLNAYEVVNSNFLIFAKNAVEELEKVFGGAK